MIRGKLGRPSRARGKDGIALVEFSLVAPIGFLLILSIIVGCVVITNLVQLTNAARDGARAAAICGSAPTAQMPDGSGTCSDTAVAAFITSHLSAIPSGSVQPQIYVCTPSEAAAGTCTSAGVRGIANCQRGRIVEVDMYYDQPLYIPLLSTIFQTNPDGSRRLNASAEATCEQ